MDSISKTRHKPTLYILTLKRFLIATRSQDFFKRVKGPGIGLVLTPRIMILDKLGM